MYTCIFCVLPDLASQSVVVTFLQTHMHTISLFFVQLQVTGECRNPRPTELKLHSLLACPDLSILVF